MQVLNFYSTVFADQMKRGRKTATIRLGDKRHKYRKNQVVLVTVGYQYSPREKLFHAVMTKVAGNKTTDLVVVPDRNHGSINDKLLTPGDPGGEAVLAFVKKWTPAADR